MTKARAVRIRGAGGPEVLSLGEIDVREPGHGELRVRVAAAGLNRADTLERRGFYPAPPGAPKDVPGLEYAGTVESVGDGVARFSVGDRVMGIVAGGGMAELVVVHEREAVPVPEGMSLEDAGAVPEVFMTAYDALFRQARIGLGSFVLLHAVGSGIGTAALQLCHAAGATPIGTTRTEAKLARCAALGLAVHGIVATDGRFAARVSEITGGRMADVVLDTVGAAYLGENVAALAPRGTMVVLGLLGGVGGELPLGLVLGKRLTIVGSVLRARPLEEKAALAQAFAHDVLPLFAAKSLRPIVDAVLPIADVAEAHRRMDANETFGKLVLAF
jgi:putative PIG3 family NAD(P)H quinone oxidoreductase